MIALLLVGSMAILCQGFLPSPQTSTLRSSNILPSAVLEFVEPETGVTVQLVGAMHYNPASIREASETIQQLAQQNRLGSVLIESCDLRWNSTLDLPPAISNLLTSEMRTAHDLAMEYQRPVVLGDQLINITINRMKDTLKETALDLINPTAGWPKMASIINAARQESLPAGPQYLGPSAIFNPALLLAAPISFFKYPLSFFVKAPIRSMILFAVLFGVDSSGAAVNDVAASTEPLALSDLLLSLGGSVLEIIIFARIFLQVLLAERNQILASNIVAQCRYYQAQPSWQQWWKNTFCSNKPSAVSYAEGSVTPRYETSAREQKGGKVVVAILGMAHCNGIRKLLEAQQVDVRVL